ncbi:MAG TPA: response regulator [Caldilineaceae bacterium]|nr:response regulator [Caldilineaceae bacterium]
MRVLYVEDSPTDADLAQREIRRRAPHIAIEIAATYQEALARLAEATVEQPIYDLVLTDVRLPDGDGLKLLAHIRARGLPLAVAVLTGQGNEELAVTALKMGADDYVVKQEGYLSRLPLTLENTLHRFRSATTRPGRPLRVLYAEHHSADIDLTRRHFARHAPHIQIEIVHTAAEVFQRLTARQARPPYDLLLLDYRLPGMNALDLVKELELSLPYTLPMVLVTGQGDEDVAVQALRLGVADYVVKHPGYLFQLPRVLENTFTQAQLERERAALHESEQRYRAIFEHAPVALYTKDLAGRYTSANQVTLAAFGADIIGHTDAEFFPEDIAAILRASDLEAMERGRSELTEEWRNLPGGERYYLTRKTALVDSRGDVTGVLGISLDITDRIRAEAERRENEMRFRQLAEHIDQVFWLQSVDSGEILYVSPAYERIWGRSCASLYADPSTLVQAIVPEDRGRLEAAQEALREGRSVEVEFRVRRAGDAAPGPIWVWAQLFPIYDEQGRLYRTAGLARDVTERRRTEEHLTQQERLIAVGQMAAGIAHDFNNILAVIMLYTQMLQLTTKNEAHLRHLATIYQQSVHAANLIQQILDFSRRSPMERVNMDMVPFVKELVRLWQRTLPETIRVELECTSAPLMVRADPARLQQALMNMAINARDAMAEGGTLRIELDALTLLPGTPPPLPKLTPGRWLRLVMSDTGSGIAPEVLNHIFDPFFTTKQPGKGTGLGLAQVYGIVQQLDGRIDVESTVGQGARFTIYLPLLEQSITAPASLLLSQHAKLGSGEIILLVEDEDALRLAISDMLTGLGYRVITAANGRDALELYAARRHEIVLVISDLVMPEMGGIELYHELRQRYPQARVLLITGYPLDEDNRLHQSGEVQWLLKPFTVEVLARRIAEALAAGVRP